jgi:uncharacterized protein
MRLAVRLTPRGGADRIDGWARDASGRTFLKVRVKASPVDGEANAALERLVARVLGVPGSAVHVVAGSTARLKSLEIAGIEPADLERVFGAAL